MSRPAVAAAKPAKPPKGAKAWITRADGSRAQVPVPAAATLRHARRALFLLKAAVEYIREENPDAGLYIDAAGNLHLLLGPPADGPGGPEEGPAHSILSAWIAGCYGGGLP